MTTIKQIRDMIDPNRPGGVNVHQMEAAVKLLDELDWTYIDPNDPATIPPTNTNVTAAWTNTVNPSMSRVGKSLRWSNGGIWVMWGHKHITDNALWYPYAWRPWPTPPPLPSEDNER